MSSTERIAELIRKRKVKGRKDKTENGTSWVKEDDFGKLPVNRGQKIKSNIFSFFLLENIFQIFKLTFFFFLLSMCIHFSNKNDTEFYGNYNGFLDFYRYFQTITSFVI